MGAVAVFERQVYYLERKVEEFHNELFSETQEKIEFHASPMRARRQSPWKGMPKEDIRQIMRSVYAVIANAHSPGVTLFGVVVEKQRVMPTLTAELIRTKTAAKHKLEREYRNAHGEMKEVKREELVRAKREIEELKAPVLGFAFERLCTQFEFFLRRFYHDERYEEQRGVMIFDHASYERDLGLLMQLFRERGTGAVDIMNVIDTPFFASSSSSRLLQLADFVSYALFRRYEFEDTGFFDLIAHRFDRADKVFHGLVHYTSNQECTCPACLTRRLAKEQIA